MEISFEVDGRPARFTRGWWSGRTELTVGEETWLLASPGRFGTHFSPTTSRTWRRTVHGHEVAVTKVRPWFAGGARSNDFLVRVDGTEVARASGR